MDTIAKVQNTKSSKINEDNRWSYHPYVIIHNNPEFAEYPFIIEKQTFKTIVHDKFIKMFARKQKS
jgi:hypothetical protein